MGRDRLNRIVGYALNRWEAYLVVLVTFVAILVAIVGAWPLWVVGACLIGGLLLMALVVADSLTDPTVEHAASLADLDLRRITHRGLHAAVLKAMEYVRGAQQLVRKDRKGLLASARDELPQMEQAVRSMYQMALRVQEFREDELIQRDLADLRSQPARSHAISESQREQLESLEKLESLIGSAEQEIEAAVAHLGQSYAELSAIWATPELRGQSSAALEELNQSTQRLSDLAQGYDEVFGQHASSEGPEGKR